MKTLDSFRDLIHADLNFPRFTGFWELDDITDGMKGCDLILLAAQPGVGSIVFSLNIASNATLKYGKRVAFFCTEMANQRRYMRIIRSRNTAFAKFIKRNPLFFDKSDWSADELISTIRKMNLAQKIDLVIIDMLQSIKSDNAPLELRNLAQELHIPIIVRALLPRHTDERRMNVPRVNDLHEIGLEAQQFDSIWILDRRFTRTLRLEDSTSAELYVLNSNTRDMGMDETDFIPLEFPEDRSTFRDTTK